MPSQPYWADDQVALYHGDCREFLPTLFNDAGTAVLTDPPWGIGKAGWDDAFHSWWMPEAARIAPVLGLMPGTWNILRCPATVGRLRYRWTLAAHLTNGMTRGAAGYSNWIPCLVYGPDPTAWCAEFAAWCNETGISSSDLHLAAGVADGGGGMASHWKTSQIPTPEQWAKLRAHFTTPWRFEAGVKADARVYRSNASDAQRVVVGRDDKPDHSSPKPLGVMRWLVDRLTFPGDMIVDPFAGSGSTLVAAKQLGRSAIGVEIDEHHCEVAAMRLSQGTLVFAELWGFERDRTEEAAEAGR